jgi:hypothetical protein
VPDSGDEPVGSFWKPPLLWSALATVALGMAYALVAGCLKESTAAIPDVPSSQSARGPFVFFLITGGAAGWILALLAERIWGVSGGVLFIPLLAQTLLACGIGTVMSQRLFGPVTEESVVLIIEAAITTLIAGGAKLYWESL